MTAKMWFAHITIALAIVMVLNANAQCDSISGWTGSLTLNAGKEYTLQYKVENDNLVIRARAKTTGFIGLGLSEAGHMMGSDIVTMAVVNGQARVEDRFSPWTAYSGSDNSVTPSTPKLDDCQSWTTLCASESGGYSDFVLKRALDTGDGEDRAVTKGNMYLIFAWGSDDTVLYHGDNRGSLMVDFFKTTSSASSFTPPSDATSTIELRLTNYNLDASVTQYVLQNFDIGTTEQHIVAVEAIVEGPEVPYVHHMLLHDCGNDPNMGNAFPLLSINSPYLTQPFPYSPLGSGPCQNMIFGWAKGGNPVAFPQEAGVRIGASAARALILEVHIDNPNGHTGKTFTSGVRLHLTSTLRTHDVATIVFGNPGADFPQLPSNQPRVHREATCPASCTNSFGGPINIFLSFPHMHSFGREIWSTKYTPGNIQTLISYKQFWNFNFQNQIPINITLNPGDSVSTHCVYDTTKAGTAVGFGTSSSQEMCMDFALYYPKANFNGLKCGGTGSGRTVCRSSSSGQNPNPDGTNEVPEVVSVGLSCKAKIGSSTRASASPFIQFILLAFGAVLTLAA